jgi:hypothetical protein
MLFPQNNPYRHYVELNGFWEFRRDLDQQKGLKGWRPAEGELLAFSQPGLQKSEGM